MHHRNPHMKYSNRIGEKKEAERSVFRRRVFVGNTFISGGQLSSVVILSTSASSTGPIFGFGYRMTPATAKDGMKVIVTGATGLVGSAVVRSCIAHPEITSVVILSRRAVPASVSQHAKVTAILHDDFLVYPRELLEAVDDAVACLWALGLKGEPLSYANSSYAQEVEVEFPLAAARTFASSLSRDNSRPFRFILCSGVGAVLDQEKPLWMLRDTRRLKTLAEESLHDITSTDPLFETYTCRPCGIVPEDIGWLASVPFMLMSKVRVVELAAVMTELAVSGSGDKRIWENDEIGRWAKELLGA
ncbi:MAG: hypothetical protein Q9163_001331 [Psora crenata]